MFEQPRNLSQEDFSIGEESRSESSPLHAAEAHRREVYERVRPSVVQICARRRGSSDPFRGIGSGFVIEQRADGTALIGTNRHVAGHGAMLEYQVLVYGEVVRTVVDKETGRETTRSEWAPVKPLTVVTTALSSGEDAAVMVVNATGLQPVTFANSNHVRESSSLYTFGYGLGISHLQFTEGKVTSRPRTPETGSNDIERLYYESLTSDADIQHGNSGGIATDVDGNVIGITTWGLPDASPIIKEDGSIDFVGGTVRSGILPINSAKVFFKNFELFGAVGEYARQVQAQPSNPDAVEQVFAGAVDLFRSQFEHTHGAASADERKRALQAILNDEGILSCFAVILKHHSNREHPPRTDLMFSLRTAFGVQVTIHALNEIEKTMDTKPEEPERE